MHRNITENTCRVCLNEQEIMINLFDEVEDFHQKLVDLLDLCGDLKVEPCDNFSKLICDGCTSELIVAARFREKCKRTQEILSQFVPTDNVEELASFVTESTTENVTTKSEIEDDDGNADIIFENPEDEENEDEILIEENETDKDDSQTEIVPTEMFEEVEFLEASEVAGQYIIPGGDGEELAMDSDNQNSEVRQIICDDQELYDRIVKAAQTAVTKRFSPKTQVLSKPLVINCKCDYCGAGFTHFNNLKRHMQTHSPNEIYLCSICSFPFTKFDKLEEHIATHSEENILKDEVAEKENTINEERFIEECPPSNVKRKIVFDKPENHKKYICETESDARELKKNHCCSHCDKRFVSKSALNAHLRIHTGDKPFQCVECPKSFTTQGGLVLHMRRHIGLRPFSCAVCSKRFVESSNLKVHMRSHTGEKPHKCTICGRSFARVFLLQIHQRTHTGERPYLCPYCGKGFAQQGDLASHKRIHTGERPHQCPYCLKGFIKSSALTQHIRKHSKFETDKCTDNVKIVNETSKITDLNKKLKEEQEDMKSFDILIVDDNEEKMDPEEIRVIVDCTNETVPP